MIRPSATGRGDAFPVASGTFFPSRAGGRPVQWAATGRAGGVSAPPFDSLNLSPHVGDAADAVEENIRRLAVAVGCPSGRAAVMSPVHGADVAEVSGPGQVRDADALVTTTAGLALVALAADCVPLALVGDDDRTLAAVHCGWRGLVGDVVGAAVEALARQGSGVAHAVLGASVCGSCYPVPADRAQQVAAAFPGPVAEAAIVSCPDGQPGIDVARGVVARLVGLGVDPDDITVVERCTVEHDDMYSYRREHPTGRQGIAVARRPS